MPSWQQLIQDFERQGDDQKRTRWLIAEQAAALEKISKKRENRNVIFYASAFLQKPEAPPHTLQLTREEINGFMSVMHGMDWSKGLTLLLHTPGGVVQAAETVVAYLWSKFPAMEVVVPTLAMSAGTMIALAADRIVMGRPSQLGPIDSQIPVGGRLVSAGAVVEQFQKAKEEVLLDRRTAHVWAPILQSLGPSLIQEAQNALDYGEAMVRGWLGARMCAGDPDKAARIAKHFNDSSMHKSHGRRIDRAEARSVGVLVEDLEDDQELQEAVLTLYHLVSIAFDKSPASKVMLGPKGKTWLKNLPQMQLQQLRAPMPPGFRPN